jgi:cell division protease FtsH
MQPILRQISLGLLGIVAFAILLTAVDMPKAGVTEANISTVAQELNAGTVEKVEINGVTAKVTKKDGVILEARVSGGAPLTEQLQTLGVSAETLAGANITYKEPGALESFFRTFGPTLVMLMLGIVFFFVIMRQMQGANNRAMTFGQANARQMQAGEGSVTFKDVAGNQEAKEELSEIVEFLKTPKKFVELGAKIPKGVLLMGPPGTGKTLIARAVAGEAGVPFFHISGSEFVEMFVGVGASRVRDLFAKAKKQAPCIIFIDEIDAVGRQRGAGLGGGHDEREQTLNQILVEMDGFEANLGVIVVAATNRPDVLDPALLRPGRFDRRVVLDRPDLKDRKAILGIHANKKPLAEDVNIDRIAERTVGFSGADLGNIMNEAAILAARQDKKVIEQIDLLNAIEKVMLGPERKSHVLSDAEKIVTAYHEAGHAIVGHLLPHCDAVHKVSIISRGRAAGYTMSIPDEDKKMHSRNEFIDELAMTLGGYAAERTIFGDFTTGASNDLQKATKLAKDLVTQYGMSDVLGPRAYGERNDMIFLGRDIHENRDYSEKMAEQIDSEINRLLNDAKETAMRIIRENRDKMDKLVEALTKEETVEKEAFEQLFGAPVKAPLMQPTPTA